MELDELTRLLELDLDDEVAVELGVVHTKPPRFVGCVLQVALLMQLREFSQPHPVCVVIQLG